jgi:hypothetical protein
LTITILTTLIGFTRVTDLSERYAGTCITISFAVFTAVTLFAYITRGYALKVNTALVEAIVVNLTVIALETRTDIFRPAIYELTRCTFTAVHNFITADFRNVAETISPVEVIKLIAVVSDVTGKAVLTRVAAIGTDRVFFTCSNTCIGLDATFVTGNTGSIEHSTYERRVQEYAVAAGFYLLLAGLNPIFTE